MTFSRPYITALKEGFTDLVVENPKLIAILDENLH